MKILGETEHGFIVEMSKGEVCKVRGYWSENYMPGHLYRNRVGLTCNISDKWEQLDSLRASKEKLSAMSKELRAYADLIEYKGEEINKEVGNDGTV